MNNETKTIRVGFLTLNMGSVSHAVHASDALTRQAIKDIHTAQKRARMKNSLFGFNYGQVHGQLS